MGPPHPSRTPTPGFRRPGLWPVRALQSVGRGRLMRSSLIQAALLGGELDRRIGSLPTTEAKLGSPGLGGPLEASGKGPSPGLGRGVTGQILKVWGADRRPTLWGATGWKGRR